MCYALVKAHWLTLRMQLSSSQGQAIISKGAIYSMMQDYATYQMHHTSSKYEITYHQKSVLTHLE